MSLPNPFLSDQMAVGLHDADGYYLIRISQLKNQKVSFQVLFGFNQRTSNEDMLELIVKHFSLTQKIRRTATQRQGSNLFYSNSILEVPANTPGGKRIFKAFDKNLPLVPSKRRDFYIISLFQQFNLGYYAPKGQPVLRPTSKVPYITLIWLAYQMSHKLRERDRSPEKRALYRLDIRDNLAHLGCTFKELYEGVSKGYQLLKGIKANCENFTNDLLKKPTPVVISEEYLMGYHIGDGNFTVTVDFSGLDHKNCTITFYWRLYERTDNRALLEGIKTSFLDNSGSITSTSSCSTLKVQSMKQYKTHLRDIFTRYVNRFPRYRYEQFECFDYIFALVDQKLHVGNLGVLNKIIEAAWNMNDKERHTDLHATKVSAARHVKTYKAIQASKSSKPRRRKRDRDP